MTALQKVNLGTAPGGDDGDPVRAAFVKMNSNVDVLATQAALVTAPAVTESKNLDVSYVGKRVPISLAASGTIGMPATTSAGQDAVILLSNQANNTVALAPASGDTINLSRLNPGETALLYVTGAYWAVLLRGRTNTDNEVVNGTLTVGGGIAGNLPVTGAVSAMNGGNLLLNSSGELGSVLGWAGGWFVSASDSSSNGQTEFRNAVSFNDTAGANWYSDLSSVYPCSPGQILSAHAEIDGSRMSAGSFSVGLNFIDANGGSTGQLFADPVNSGYAGYFSNTCTMTAPAGTVGVAMFKSVHPGAVGPAGGVRFRRCKLNVGAPSLYSQEAAVAYLKSQMDTVGKVLLATKIMSGNSACIFNNLDTLGFDSYEIEFYGVLPHSSGSGLNMCAQFSTDNGATWFNAAQYRSAITYMPTAGVSANTIGSATYPNYPYIQLWGAPSNVAGSPVFATYEGEVKTSNFAYPTVCPSIKYDVRGTDSGSANAYAWGRVQGHGQLLALSGKKVNAMSILMSDGSGFDRGAFKLYGIR